MVKTRPLDQMRFVAFDVTDIEEARAFYVNQLGFPVVDEEPGRFAWPRCFTNRAIPSTIGRWNTSASRSRTNSSSVSVSTMLNGFAIFPIFVF